MESMIILALPVVAGGIALSDSIVKIFYGSSFGPSVLAMQLLMFIAGISFVSYPYSIVLVVSDHQKKNFILIVAGAIVNIVLNFFFVLVFGFYGVIISTIIACSVVLFSSVFLSKKLNLIKPFSKNLFKTTLISLLSSLLMYYVVSWKLIAGLNIICTFLIGVSVYVLLLFVFYKIFYPEKLDIFKKR